jgi:hypothetical protein
VNPFSLFQTDSAGGSADARPTKYVARTLVDAASPLMSTLFARQENT